MGCGISRSGGAAREGVRVVHVNGYVEDFPAGVIVADVTRGLGRKLMCFTAAELLSFSGRPLPDNEKLLSGRLYFLVPSEALRSDVSPADLAALVTRLTAVARNKKNRAVACPAQPPDPPPVVGGAAGLVGLASASRARCWKPDLDTIEEKSFRSSNG